MPIQITHHAGVALLRIELGRGNAIDQTFIDGLNAALDEVERSDARAVMITGQGRVFCGGLDLVTLHRFDRPTFERFIHGFDRLVRRVFSFDRPTVAAINGHALAGGAVLAMACDIRVMADGPYQLGFNEVQLSIPFPPATFEITRRSTPPGARAAAFLQGKRFPPEEAHRLGLVQRLAPDGDTVAAAREEANLVATAGAMAVRTLKAELCAPTLARIDASPPTRMATFVDAWFSPDAQARIGELRAVLVAKQQRPAG